MSNTPSFETAFLVVLGGKGQIFATSDVVTPIQINREATRDEVSQACRVIYDKMVLEDTAAAIALAVNPKD